MLPKFLVNRWHGQHILWLFVFMLLLIITLFIYEWWVGLAALIGAGGLVYYVIVAESAFRKEFKDYVMTLTHRVKKAGKEAVSMLPIGIVAYNEEETIVWHNSFVGNMFEFDSGIDMKLEELFPNWNKDDELSVVEMENKFYRMEHRIDERVLYLFDITEFKVLKDRYEEEKIALGFIMLDNVDELMQGMDDQTRSALLAKVVGLITEWARLNEIVIRRMASDRFLMIMDQRALAKLEKTRFEVLDEVRELTKDYKLPITLSIGVGSGLDKLTELGTLAQTSLDMALGRGGDQAAVKAGERLSFYGGRSNAVEKRTRVRARVISHTLRELIRESDKVIIMGHKMPDMDSIGAAIGVLKAAKMCNKEGYIVFEGVNPSITRLMEELEQHEELHKWFITPEQAAEIMSEKSLAVVVDTHKASMVAEPRLVHKAKRIFVIDHHRRGEEFIDEAVLIYIEPYASSTSELVAELLQYLDDRISLDVIEATAMLAGIVVDTKSFSMRTGARTFEAASFLRRHGADSSLIQRMLKEDLQSFIRKSEVIKHAKVLYDHVAIATADPGKTYSQLLIAQVADTLLNITDIYASFVICERPDGKIGISARSLGQINVQVIMEEMGGGGHLSNAAAQLDDASLEEVEQRLQFVLHEIQQEEGLFE